MTIVGLSVGAWLGILFIGLSPIRTMLVYMGLARYLPLDVQRQLALRTVLIGALLAGLILLIGGAIARSYAARPEVLLIAGGLVLGIQALRSLGPQSLELPEPPKIADPLQLAISPLAIPLMITPVGVVALFYVAMVAPDASQLLAFFGLVVAVLALNFGAMLLSRHLSRFVTTAILGLIQQVFGLLILGMGVRLVLEGLTGLGVTTAIGI
jgi:multiple antibiotic resistance protein